MIIGGDELLVHIENANPKLGIYLRNYLLPAIQSRGLPGQVLATPANGVGNVQLQSLGSLVTTANPKSAAYVGTDVTGAVVPATTPTSGINELTGDVLAGPGIGPQASEVVGINGAALPASSAYVGTNSSRQIVPAATPTAPTVITNEVISGSGTAWTLVHAPGAGIVPIIAVMVAGFGGVPLFLGATPGFTITGANLTTTNSYLAGALRALWYQY